MSENQDAYQQSFEHRGDITRTCSCHQSLKRLVNKEAIMHVCIHCVEFQHYGNYGILLKMSLFVTEIKRQLRYYCHFQMTFKINCILYPQFDNDSEVTWSSDRKVDLK